jgi:hypothetical protein
MVILSQVARPDTSPLTINNLSRLRRSRGLIGWVVLRLGIVWVRLLILDLLLVSVAWRSGIGKVCWGWDTWWTDVVRTAVLSRNGSQMRDWVKVDIGSGGWTDFVVGGLVTWALLLLGVEGWRSLVM